MSRAEDLRLEFIYSSDLSKHSAGNNRSDYRKWNGMEKWKNEASGGKENLPLLSPLVFSLVFSKRFLLCANDLLLVLLLQMFFLG